MANKPQRPIIKEIIEKENKIGFLLTRYIVGIYHNIFLLGPRYIIGLNRPQLQLF